MNKGNPLWQTKEWKLRQSENARRLAAAFWARPRCGAKTKAHGGPCRMVALANGRCRFHGGKTPKGADWHKPVFSDGKTPGGQDKLSRKLYDLDRARQKRAQRLAAMTPAECAAYRKWHEARQPSQAARISYRARKRQAQEAKAALARAAGRDSADPELLQLDEKIRRLEEQAAALMAKRAEAAAAIEELGIFG